ncbi:MAG TPA: stage II sporulation protein M, partial [Gemmatimonadales bacterium]
MPVETRAPAPNVPAPAPSSFARRVAVETPEHVVIELELAGMGSRAAAALYDSLIIFVLVVLITVGLALARAIGARFGNWFSAVWILTSFATLWGYFMIYEGLQSGRTPGKRRLGIRVVMDTGHPITFQAAAVRNLIRLVDVQPGVSYLIGLIAGLFHSQNKRLGDMVAGTIVVRDRPDDMGLGFAVPAADVVQSVELGPPELTDDEFRLLAQFLERAEHLGEDVRQRFLHDLTDRFTARHATTHTDPWSYLSELYASEMTRRGSRFAAGGPSRRAAGARPSVTAERFVARKRAAWERFRGEAVAAESLGLTSLIGDEVVRFAEHYREVAADLARARTYGLDPRVIDYLERIVSAGHNALYGAERTQRRSFAQVLLGDLPGAVVEARAYVLTAFLIFAATSSAGYLVLRERPDLAQRVLPAGIIARAEAGGRDKEGGKGYAQAPSPYLPVMASSIIANNVQVAFLAFAFGVTAGVGTVVVLAFNGLFFGAVLALFANYSLAGWILTFVAGHGVLELTAIFIAGGGGLLIGKALVAPGDLTRRDALVVRGRVAIRMVGAAASLLLLAGTIEGLLSASDAPSVFKFLVSGASAVLLALYFSAGARANRARVKPA